MKDLFHRCQILEQSCLISITEKYKQLLDHNLKDACVQEYMKIKMNKNKTELNEIKTREQPKSELWYKARSGVITVSN